MKNKVLYILMCVLVVVCLCIPFIQMKFHIFNVKPLDGVISKTPKPELNFKSYISGEFQKTSESYLSENYGLREPTIRLYNQYVWSFYHKNFNEFFIPGKNNWIFYLPSVKDYYGKRQPKKFATKAQVIEFIDNEVDMMCALRDSLKHYNTEFLSFIAPDKSFIYPEYLPTEGWKRDTTAIRISDFFSKKLAAKGFPNINMTDWFIHIKDTVDYQLFKRMDFHWDFSAAFGYDSLFRLMSSLNGLNIPQIKIDSLTTYIDNDRQNDEKMLNLLFRIKDPTIQHKSHVSVQCDDCQKPIVLFISDSFILAFNEHMPVRKLLQHEEVWYYNTTCMDGFNSEKHRLEDVNRLRRVLRADYVVYGACNFNWDDGTMGFAKSILDDLKDRDLVKISLTMNEIETDTNWMKALKIQTGILSLPLEKVLEIEAHNVINNNVLLRDKTEISEEALINMKLEKIKEELRSNPEAMENISIKAKNKGISVEEMLNIDAKWVMDYQNSLNK